MKNNRFYVLRVTLTLLAAAFTLWPDQATAQQGGVDAMLRKNYVGLWNKMDDIGWRSVISLNADGTCSNAKGRFATWELDHNELVIRYDASRDGLNRFTLPPRDGVLKGKTDESKPRTMAMRATSAPAATYAAMTGEWEYFNHVNGHRAIVTLAADGSVYEEGKFMAVWLIENNRLYYSYIEHHDWVDSYDLPPKGGVLYSAKGNLTLTQQRAVNAASLATTAVPPTATASPVLATTTEARPGYFGTREGGVVPGGAAAATPLPSITATPSIAIPAGSFATGGAGVTKSIAPTVAPTPLATVAAATPAEILTPVGKWHWHDGADHTLTDKGAVLEGARVVGQWKWLDKSKNEIQFQATTGAYRAPIIYTLSPHGNHLTGKSPTSGNEHTEERAE